MEYKRKVIGNLQASVLSGLNGRWILNAPVVCAYGIVEMMPFTTAKSIGLYVLSTKLESVILDAKQLSILKIC